MSRTANKQLAAYLLRRLELYVHTTGCSGVSKRPPCLPPCSLTAVVEALCKSMVEAEGAAAQMAKVRGTSNYNGQFAPICSAARSHNTLVYFNSSTRLSR